MLTDSELPTTKREPQRLIGNDHSVDAQFTRPEVEWVYHDYNHDGS
jgi:hypothetical protein